MMQKETKHIGKNANRGGGKRLVKLLIALVIMLQCCTCFNWKENPIADRYAVLNPLDLQECSQVYITDSNVFLMYYDFASPDAYDPFRMDPYLLCYNNNLELQWCKFVDALEIVSIHNDTIVLLGRYNETTKTDISESWYLKYIPFPSSKGTVCYKVVDSMDLDTISGNVILKYREYNDHLIGLRTNPQFFEDTTNTYSAKTITLNHYDIIFNSHDEPDTSLKCIKTLDLTPNQMYHDIWILNDYNILLDFYNDLYNYIRYSHSAFSVLSTRSS